MNEQPDQGRVKGMEARLFLFLVICLFPLLSVALVGGFGFCVWMYPLLAGPPGPPACGRVGAVAESCSAASAGTRRRGARRGPPPTSPKAAQAAPPASRPARKAC